APTVEECEAMVEAGRRNKVKLQMGCMKRHDPTLERAHEFAREQMGGQLLVSGWCFDSAYHGRYVETLGRRPERGEAQVYPEAIASPHLRDVAGYGVHSLDLVLWFGGPVAKVSTFGVEGDDRTVSVSALEFASGALGTFQVVRTVQMDWTEGVQVHGVGGSVIAHTPFPYFHRHADVTIFDAAQQAYMRPAAPGADMYQRQLEAFARAIFEDGPVSPSGEDGLRDQQVILAMHESYQTGQSVQLSESGARR
ncbi:MAG: Gfo/Idh/MocA family protein, partial [Armatimonadota bacterium]